MPLRSLAQTDHTAPLLQDNNSMSISWVINALQSKNMQHAYVKPSEKQNKTKHQKTKTPVK